MAGPTLQLDDCDVAGAARNHRGSAEARAADGAARERPTEPRRASRLKTAALLNMLRGLVDYVGAHRPAAAGRRLRAVRPGARASLGRRHDHAPRRSATTARSDGGQRQRRQRADRERMTDASVAQFVADSVVAERGATERLAHAFQALVPELDRQRQLLALAREGGRRVRDGANRTRSSRSLWHGVEHMLTSYTDARYVSDDYAPRALAARAHAAGRRRARQRRSARADRGVARDGQRRALRSLDHHLLTRPAAHRRRPAALARRRRYGRAARRRSGARRPLRSGVAADRSGHRSARRTSPFREPHATVGARAVRHAARS